MKLDKYIIGLIVGAVITMTSCDDFLNQLPDNRAEIQNATQVRKLLVGAYSAANYAAITELSSDNIVDNNSPDEDGVRYNLQTYNKMDNEIFAWQEIKSGGTAQDTPYFIWDRTYYAIAVANAALEAIDEIRETNPSLSGEDKQILINCEAEALLARAYNHFILVNVFCQAYRDDVLSNDPVKAQGIPYVTKSEDKVYVHYERGTVAGVYASIEKDLEAALKLINEHNATIESEIPKYHFTSDAAHAFAARFYLYKRDYAKVIEHANRVLGTGDPAAKLRVWNNFEGMVSAEPIAQEWASSSSPSNLMLISTNSIFSRRFNGAYRYQCNRDAARGTILGATPTNNIVPSAVYKISGWSVPGSPDYGYFSFKIVPIFEYTDKLAGTGYEHSIRREFTSEETLLCRAEAYLYMEGEENLDKAFEDLKAWDWSRQQVPASYLQIKNPLEKEDITSFYRAKSTDYVKKLNSEKMSPSFILPDGDKRLPYLHCLLHFRRLETWLDGMRWFDLKRYGIEITHAIGKDVVDTLTWDDPRRAIQVPQEAIAAGLQPNYRN